MNKKLHFFCAFFLFLVFTELLHPKNCYQICSEQLVEYWCPNAIPTEEPKVMPLVPETAGIYRYIDGQLYVKVSNYTQPAILYRQGQPSSVSRWHQLIDAYAITAIEPAFPRLPQMQQYYRVKFNHVHLTAELMLAIRRFAYVELVEQVPLHRTFLTPNDIAANQYNVLITECEQAWDIVTGNPNIVIGMVDDAVLLSHEDLAPNIWTNAGEIPGNGIDDDGNGYIDDVNGWDAADNDNNPNPPAGANDNSFSHGTHCAGIAAGATNNGLGMASVSYNVSLMAVKIAADATEQLTGAMEGVEYAIAAGADVISMSWGGGAPSATEQAVFTTAHNLGITLVAAAGNDNTDNLMYPASYQYVISVGASDDNDLKAGFSNYGDSIDVMAPGVQIFSSVATNNSAYTNYDGTSMACPFVSGLAALMLSLDPNLSPDRIEQCLEETADNIDALNPGFENQLGAGRVNAFRAVMCVPSEPLAAFTANFTGNACAGQPIQFTDMSGGIDLSEWQWSFPGGTPASSNLQNPVVTYPANGAYNVTLIVTNYLGVDTITKPITIGPPTATIGNDTLIIAGYPAYLTINFTGMPPWNVTYNNGATNITVNNITQNPLIIPVFPAQNTNYTIVSTSDAVCNGIAQGNAFVTVDGALDDPDSPYYLVQQVLLGGGCLSVSNVQYTGHPDALGYFEQTPNLSIGFAEGVMITTGYNSIAYGPNNDTGSTEPGGGVGTPGDPDLDDILDGGSIPTESYDAAVLEFDFVPSTDNISFRYVFGSEEYLEFVGTGFNDVFAFFISGPGIAGEQNIALIPGTTIPVTINNVNDVDYPAYYVNTPNNAPYTQFDGITTTLTATKTDLIPCETYHIKLAIADAGDRILDSGVFLEANSFSDGSVIDVQAFGAVPGTVQTYEGCASGQFVFIRQDLSTLNQDYIINLTIAGSAINGVDYVTIPPQVIIPAGDTTYTLIVDAFNDGITEPIETVTLFLTDIQCDCTFTPLQATLLIFDNLTIDAGNTVSICPGQGAQLQASGGSNYVWSPVTGLSNPNIANPIASPTQSTWYTVQGVDAYGCNAQDSVLVYVYNVPYLPPFNLDTAICSADIAVIPLQTTNPISNYNYQWIPATGLDNPNSPNPTATISATTTYTLLVTNPQGCVTTQSVTIEIAQLSAEVTLEDAQICPGDEAALSAGDFAAYVWSNGAATPTITVTQAGEYSVTVTDLVNGCTAEATATVSLLLQPEPQISGDLNFVSGQTTTLYAGTGYAGYEWNTGATSDSLVVGEPGTYSVTVFNNEGCRGAATATVTETIVAPFLIPSAFSPNGDDVNDVFRIVTTNVEIASLKLHVRNRWGEEVFFSDRLTEGWNGKFKSQDCEMGVYVYYGSITLPNGEVKEFQGNVTLIR
ncbi:MAG TPA: choice-of-anchor L domain-containing protein [Chitinophagales bacterium]|nr:choice-of-anchor L domain-containing protein [Chitinophagales bacterium]HRK26503.1 choice-of-anchor L domain-containing protein [Chitinophagales bacterium]